MSKRNPKMNNDGDDKWLKILVVLLTLFTAYEFGYTIALHSSRCDMPVNNHISRIF